MPTVPDPNSSDTTPIRSRDFFVAGGSLRADAPCYVVRQADESLLSALESGRFCYILDTRQVGKSSLLARAATLLRRKNYHVVIVDLTGIGTQVAGDAWFLSLLHEIAEPLGFGDDALRFWSEAANLSPVARLRRAMDAVILDRLDRPLCVLIDEIDAARSLPSTPDGFSSDEFFAGLRALIQEHRHRTSTRRLTLCLCGAAPPGNLIQNPKTTPFNLGTPVLLTDFTLEQARKLQPGGTVSLPFERILYWTGGQPYLTQKLCQGCMESGAVTPGDVDRVCETLFLTKHARQSEIHLATIARQLTENTPDPAALLILLQRVGARGVPGNPANPLHEALRFAGVATLADGILVPRNRIVARVFDAAWIRQNLPDSEKRRQSAAQRRGVLKASIAYGVVSTAGGGALWWFQRAREAEARLLRESKRAGNAEEERDSFRARGDRARAELARQMDSIGLARETLRRQTESIDRAKRQIHGARAEEIRLRIQLARLELQEGASTREAERARRELQIVQKRARQTEADLRGTTERADLIRGVLRPRERPALAAAVRATQRLPDDPLVTQTLADIVTGGLLQRFRVRVPFEIWSATYSPDGTRIAIAGKSGEVQVLDAESGAMIAEAWINTSRPPANNVEIWTARFLPDGGLITTAQDAVLDLWKIDGRKLTIARSFPLLAAEDDPEEKKRGNFVAAILGPTLVAVSAPGNCVRAVDIRTGATTRIAPKSPERILSLDARRVALDAGPTDILAVGYESGVVRIYDWRKPALVSEIVGYRDDPGARIGPPTARGDAKAHCVRLTSDLVLVAGTRPAPVSFGVRDRMPFRVYQGNTPRLLGVDVSPTESLVAAGGDDGIVRIWARGTPKREPLHTFGRFTEPITEVCFRPAAPFDELLATSKDRTLEVWRLTAPRLITGTGGPMNDVQTLGKTDICWTAGNLVQLARSRCFLENELRRIAVSPDGRRVAAVGDGGAVRLFDANDPGPIAKFVRLDGHIPARVNDCVFSLDGKVLFTAGRDDVIRWDLTRNRETHRFSWGGSHFQSLTLSPDGRILLFSADDGGTRLVDSSNLLGLVPDPAVPGKRLALPAIGVPSGRGFIVPARSWEVDLAVDPLGEQFYSVGTDGNLCVWPLLPERQQLMQPTHILGAHQGSANALDISKDKTLVATCGDDGLVRLWNLAALRRGVDRSRVAFRTSESVRAARFTTDGQSLWVATGDGLLRLVPVTRDALIAHAKSLLSQAGPR